MVALVWVVVGNDFYPDEKTKSMSKESTELYYKLESKQNQLKQVLEETRDEPVFGLKSIANIVKKVFDKSEISTLIEELKR